MAKMTEEQIKKILEGWNQTGTYSGAAKYAGTTPATAKKYILAASSKKEENKKQDMLRESDLFKNGGVRDGRTLAYIGEWTKFTQEEKEKLKELRSLL